jgi:hypothetical protein
MNAADRALQIDDLIRHGVPMCQAISQVLDPCPKPPPLPEEGE